LPASWFCIQVIIVGNLNTKGKRRTNKAELNHQREQFSAHPARYSITNTVNRVESSESNRMNLYNDWMMMSIAILLMPSAIIPLDGSSGYVLVQVQYPKLEPI
jgi:hypothetical protein